MLRALTRLGRFGAQPNITYFSKPSNIVTRFTQESPKPVETITGRYLSPRFIATSSQTSSPSGPNFSLNLFRSPTNVSQICIRHFHAARSKINYLDFRHRFKTHHLRLNMLIIRRKKMKKHQRKKFRKKFKFLLAKKRLKREIAKEKTFRVELLTVIRDAESFDPREYAMRKITEMNNVVKELSKEEKLEQLKQLIRENRYQVDYIKPKHRRIDI